MNNILDFITQNNSHKNFSLPINFGDFFGIMQKKSFEKFYRELHYMRLNIHKKVLILVLGTGLVTFLVLNLFSYFGRNAVQRDMNVMSVELGEKSASYTEYLLTEQLKNTLGELAEANAQFIDSTLASTRIDAEMLSLAMTEIMSHPENYSPKTLVDPRTSPVKNAQAYLIFSPDIMNKVTPKMQNDIALAANIQYFLVDLLKNYLGCDATAFVGSEDGWFICAALDHDSEGNTDLDANIPIIYERIYEYDARNRPWYITGKNAMAPVICDIYRTVEEGENSYQQIGGAAPFYDKNGNFLGVVGIDYSNSDLYQFINELNTTKGSINFVLNKNGEVVISSQAEGIFSVNDSATDLISRAGGRDLRKNSEETIANAAKKMIAGEEGVTLIKLNDENYYLAYSQMENTGWSFGMIVSEAEILKPTMGTQDYFLSQVTKLQEKMHQEYSYINNLIIIVPIILLVILFLMSTNLSRRFVKPINELSDGVREISAGNLDKKLDIHTGDEIEHLAICFNAMTDELKKKMANLTKETAEKERLATELDVAKDIQSGMLPKDFPTRTDFELFATMTPAKEVGGDFYDFYFIDETHLAITVADVSGKGIPAALFMVISKTVLNNFAQSFYKLNGLAPVVAAANEQLCANNDAMMFVTAFVGVLDLETGEFTFVNAGHNPPVIYRAENNFCEFLDVKKNFVMGPMDGIPFSEQKIILKHGDLLFLYTDGVTEALNVAEEEYLPERLIKFMNSTDCTADLQTLLKNMRGDLAKHVGEAEQSDDITMFALRFK